MWFELRVVGTVWPLHSRTRPCDGWYDNARGEDVFFLHWLYGRFWGTPLVRVAICHTLAWGAI